MTDRWFDAQRLEVQAILERLDDAEKVNEIVIDKGWLSQPYVDGLRAGFGDARAVVEAEYQRLTKGRSSK